MKSSNIYLTIIAIVLIFSTTACNGNMSVKVERVMKSPLILPTELSDSNSVMNIIRYVKPKSCTSCELDLGMWRIYRKNLLKQFGNKIGLKFIIDTKNVTEAAKLLRMYKFRDDAWIDSISSFAYNNKAVAAIGSDVVMLVDNKNNVIMIGNPCTDIKIQHVTDSILNQVSKVE